MTSHREASRLPLSEPSKRGRTSREKKQKEGRGEEPEQSAMRKQVIQPLGAPPLAMVEVRHDGRTIERPARGYSLGEIEQVNLSVGVARRWGVSIDERRGTTLESNVSALAKWAPEPEGRRAKVEEKVEGELRKVEREVVKEARRVEGEAKRVEKELVQKVEEPIKKRSGGQKKGETKRKQSSQKPAAKKEKEKKEEGD